MTDAIAQILLTAGAGTAGILATKAYDVYNRSKSKTDKADALKKLYDTLENLYSEDLELQKKLNLLAKENESLKQLIEELKDGN